MVIAACAGLAMTRRAWMAGLTAMGIKPAAGAALPRLVVLDWGLAETLLVLGVVPVGAAEVPDYNQTVSTLRLPAGVEDVGLRLNPDMEILQVLSPDFILINGEQGNQRALLERIAPVWSFSIYDQTGTPLLNAEKVTGALAARLGCSVKANAFLRAFNDKLDAVRSGLADYDGRPLYLFNFLDARHIALYDRSSLVGNVVERLGGKNAWLRASGGWGVVPLPVESLAATPEARLICFGPVPEDARRMMAENLLWKSLPAVKGKRLRLLPAVWNYGALPTALRMAEMLGNALRACDV